MSDRPKTNPLYTNEESSEVLEVENKNSRSDENDSVDIDFVQGASSNGLNSNQRICVALCGPGSSREGYNSADKTGMRRRLYSISEHKDITQTTKRIKPIFGEIKMLSFLK